jgi:TP901 family phage tail tape measure protein
MGVRTIGFRFTGDYRDLNAALDQAEARIKHTVATTTQVGDQAAKATQRSTTGVRQASEEAARSAERTTTGVKKSSSEVAKATGQVVTAEQRATTAVEAHGKAQQTVAALTVKAQEAQARAAKAAAASELQVGTGAELAEARKVAAAEAGAAKRAAAELSVAKAAEVSAAQQVTVAQAAAAKEAAVKEAALRRVAQVELAAYREDEARSVKAAAAQQDMIAKRARASEQVGRGLLLVGAATGAGIGIAVKAFADFDSAISRAAAGTQATTAEVGKLRQAALQAGADTQFSATEAADGITALGKAGISIQNILGGGLKGALDLAAAGELSVADAADIAATALTQFHLSGKELPHVADLLAAAAGKAQGEVSDLGNALKYVGPVAQGLGISIEQTTGVLAEFASQGVIGEQAGTSLRGVLLSLTSPSEKAEKQLSDLGISVYDAQGKFVGLQGVAGQLQSALGDMDAASRDAALGVIFGNEQVTAARVLYAGGAQAVQQWTDKVNDAGFASRQAARLTDNLSGDLERLTGSLSSVFIASGSGANGFLRGLTQGLNGAVNAFGDLPDGAQQAALAVAAVAGAAALTGGALLVLLPRIAAAKVAMAELGVSAGTARGLLLAVGRLAGVVGVLYAVGQGIEQITPKAEDSAASIRDLQDALQKVQSGQHTGNLQGLGEDFKDLGANLNLLADPGLMNRFSDFTSVLFSWASGSLKGRQAREEFLDDLSNLDTALTGLVTSGHADQAAELFDELNKRAVASGAGVDQLAKHLPGYTAAADSAATASAAAGGAASKLGENFGAASVRAQQLATTIKAAADAAGSATQNSFSADTNVLGSYDPTQGDAKSEAATERLGKAKEHLADVEERIRAKRKDASLTDQQALRKAQEAVHEAQANVGKSAGVDLSGTYKDAIRSTREFTGNISVALSRGLDPRYVQKLLEEGPKKAGPILQEILADHSGALIKMVNTSEGQLARLNALAVEQARLTATAIASSSDQMTSDLAEAIRIAGEKSKQGAKATAESIAESLKIAPGSVEAIAHEFGITLMASTQEEVSKRQIEVPAQGKVTIKTAGTVAAISRIDEVRAAVNRLKGKTITVRVNGTADSKSTLALLRAGAINARGQAVIGSAGGGLIPRHLGGPRDDNVLRAVSAGEWVIRARSVDHYGDEFLRAVNEMRLPRATVGGPVRGMADGGPVSARPVYASTAPATVAQRAAQGRPVVVRVPVHETHTRTIQTGDVVIPGASPRDFEDWAAEQQRRADRSYS